MAEVTHWVHVYFWKQILSIMLFSISNLYISYQRLEKVSDRVGANVTDNVTGENVANTHLLGFSPTNKIINIETNMSNTICSCKQRSAISLYSLCFSTLKPCNYWDSKTVTAVVNFGTTLYNHTGVITLSNLPKKSIMCMLIYKPIIKGN